ncbi:DUF547 domain-containing protein [Ekhidna sp.]|uniref:DUF547 domain-containing protein n=1 Tax=Ekhidna sp. TaxID=2608089 RepID=UPI003BABE439
MNKFTVFFITILMSFGLFSQSGVSHNAFDQLLQKYVDDEGMVNYKGLKAERSELKSYLSTLENNAPRKTWTRDQKLAYWINAYNAYTLELILEHYPVESIKDIGSTIKIPFVSTAWDIKFINIGGEEYDLNNIEHGIIRKDFDEPRIHFALVCAAVSCPKLQNRAYLPEKLDAQLTKAAKEFLSNSAKNRFKNENQATLSKLFNWYGGDFKNDGTLIEYINKYAPTKLSKNADIDWMDYNWKLNEQK